MTQWEYHTTFFEADTEASPVPLHEDLPIEHYAPHTPYSLIPQLNALGAKGWELLSIEPVVRGKKDDVMSPDSGGGRWATTYLCAFKRPIAE